MEESKHDALSSASSPSTISTTAIEVPDETADFSLPPTPQTLAEEEPDFSISISDALTQDLNPANTIFHAEIYKPSSQGPCFASVDQAFWYNAMSPLLTNLLEKASYPAQLLNQYFSFFRHSVIPSPGSACSTNAKWTPHLTHNHSPFEPSINIYGSGTSENHQFFISAFETEKIQGLIPREKCSPTCFLAFDLDTTNFEVTLKPYLFPHHRAALESKKTKKVVFSSICKINDPSLLPALETIENFLAGREYHGVGGVEGKTSNLGFGGGEMRIEMLLFDCIAADQGARIKLYAKTNDTSFANVSEIWTLAGKRFGAKIDEGLEALKEF
ncbi:hypothetical protein G7Y89_g8081 [Cudoniella acicularis]|uniref:Uncharacterized protein n=1 Tax=Cudoniella acicularis TaxID=354080 RepID=A0A8H4W370_9HELO|nr:hypothetical protein G7Y89_g8081 [Cudoniella acicularis]